MHIVEAVHTGGSAIVTVCDAINKDVRAGLAAMTTSAVMCDVISAAVVTQVELCASAHISARVYNVNRGVTPQMDRVSCDVMGTQIMKLQMFIKTKLPKGMEYRKLV